MREDSITAVPTNLCLQCGQKLDAATDTLDSGARPKEDDISLCLYCGAFAAFTGEGRLRPLTDEENSIVNNDPRIMVAQAAIIAANKAGLFAEKLSKRGSVQ
jgi:hypothetical protein